MNPELILVLSFYIIIIELHYILFYIAHIRIFIRIQTGIKSIGLKQLTHDE